MKTTTAVSGVAFFCCLLFTAGIHAGKPSADAFWGNVKGATHLSDAASTETLTEKEKSANASEKMAADKITSETLMKNRFIRIKSKGAAYECPGISVGQIQRLFGVSKHPDLRFLTKKRFILNGRIFYLRKKGVVLGIVRSKSLSDSDDTTVTARVFLDEKEYTNRKAFRELGFKEEGSRVFTHEGVVLQEVLDLLLIDAMQLRLPPSSPSSLTLDLLCVSPNYSMVIRFPGWPEREKGVDGKVSVRIEFKHELGIR